MRTLQALRRIGRRGFTVTELLVVVALVAVLLALIMSALGGVATSGRMAKAASNMRWIGTAMTLYSGDARDIVLPSRFNHQDDAFPGPARSSESLDEEWHLRGTWADTLWTRHEMGAFPEAGIALGNDYRYDSPDDELYDLVSSSDFDNPLRSPAGNTIDTSRGDVATPYGIGALERADPGYFAANDFFNDDKASRSYNDEGPISNAQIRIPERSLYLVDSFAGEIIDFNHFCDVKEHT